MNDREMVEVRFHGRGGQGAVLAAALTAQVAFDNGYEPQAFPTFGAERRGAPVMAFMRYGKGMLLPRSRIYKPDCIVAFDAELPKNDVLKGLEKEKCVVLNAPSRFIEAWFQEAKGSKLFVINASEIAYGLGLMTAGMPLVSCIMVGAVVKVLGLADKETMGKSLWGKIPGKEKENIEGAKRGYDEVEEVAVNGVR